MRGGVVHCLSNFINFFRKISVDEKPFEQKLSVPRSRRATHLQELNVNLK